MKSYSLLIVDDEPLSRSLMREFLMSHPEINLLGECASGGEAVARIQELNPDLICLDIHLPQLNGFEVLQEAQRHHGVIFTTAYDQYAIKAFELHAIDYLLKPFSQSRFDQALERAAQRLETEAKSSMQQLIDDGVKQEQRLRVKDRDQIYLIPWSDIDYLHAEDDYVHIHWNGKSILKTQSLNELETQLPADQFVRIHRSYLVRADKIYHLEKPTPDSTHAVLKNGMKLPVSRAGHQRLKSLD